MLKRAYSPPEAEHEEVVAMDVWTEVEAERRELAELLEDLSDEEWDAPTLCGEWDVRHVVAHLTPSNISVPKVLTGVVKAGFNFNRYIANEALHHGTAEPVDLLERFRDDVGSRKTPPSAKAHLGDVFMHQQDIRRPLGRPRDITVERAIFIADQMKGRAFPLPAKQRIKGVRLEATDADWSHGDGPVVRGPLEALVMTMGGRPAALDDIEGEGVETLRPRL